MTESLPYNPVQSHADHQRPNAGDFPPVLERVPQRTDASTPIEEIGATRVTYQGNELCNLQCPGCYLTEWLEPEGKRASLNLSRKGSVDAYTDHLKALGESLEEVYLLGAEITMTPDDTRNRITQAKELGLTVMAVTNGSARPAQVDRALLHSLEQNDIYKLNVSIDSTNREVNDYLRGKSGACEATLETMRRYIEQGFPVKAQMVVWPYNYATIMESVQELYHEYGVRGFAFHCGSLEGISDEAAASLGGHLNPEAWRALCEQLENFNQEHFEDLEHFNFPYIYFTRDEIAKSIIGVDDLAEAYYAHTDELEAGAEDKPLPFNACPAIGTPQVYMYANDPSAVGAGRLSLCNIETGMSGKYFADFDETTRKFSPVASAADNQLVGMVNSSNLCPAMEGATGGINGTGSDRISTPSGDLFHACRYISNNQLPTESGQFGSDVYQRWLTHYGALNPTGK